MITQFKRTIKYGFKIITRDGEIFFTSISILFIVVSLISSLFIFKKVSEFLIYSLKEKANVSVYFKEDAPQEEILKIKEEISKNEQFHVEFISKEKALKDFELKHQRNNILMEALKEIGYNPFLASLEIKSNDPFQYEVLMTYFKEKENLIEKIDYAERKPLIDKIFSLSSNIEKVGMIISLVLVLISIFVVFNTTRLSLLNFQEEIFIQKLVGASSWFIRGQFLVQGFLAGMLASALSCVVLVSFLYFVSPKVEMVFPGLNLFSILKENIQTLLIIQLSSGILLGIVPTLFALRRFLKI